MTFPDWDAHLEEALTHGLRTSEEAQSSQLLQSIRYSLLGGGKRIRPRLVWAVGQTVETPYEALKTAALAIEMFHCFTLIHDDLPCLDNDDFRRGKPSNHKAFGEAMALLAGDRLYALGVETMQKAAAYVDPKQGFSALVCYLKYTGVVIDGQCAELELNKDSSVSQLKSVHRQKTGALFSAAVLIPALLVGLSPLSMQYEALERFGAVLGESFQLIDDYEDWTQDASQSLRSIFNHMDPGALINETLGTLEQLRLTLSSVFGDQAAILTPFIDELQIRLKQEKA